MHMQDSTCVQVKKVEVLMWHGMEARAGFDVVVVVVRNKYACWVHGKCPEAVKVNLLAQFQCRCDQHEATA